LFSLKWTQSNGYQTSIEFDLQNFEGIHYHTEWFLAAYTVKFAQAIALGGRYDDIDRISVMPSLRRDSVLDLKKNWLLVSPNRTDKRSNYINGMVN